MEVNVDQIRKELQSFYDLDVAEIQKHAEAILVRAKESASQGRVEEFYKEEVKRFYADKFDFIRFKLAADLEDKAFSDFPEKAGLRDRSIEQLLDEAIRYLANCTALRKEYADLAAQFVDSCLQSIEFLFLDVIHQAEIEDGQIYLNPFKDAALEVDSNTKQLDLNKNQLKIYNVLFNQDDTTIPTYDTYKEKTNPLRDTLNDMRAVSDLLSRRVVLTVPSWDTEVAWRGLADNIKDDGRGRVAIGTALSATRRAKLEERSWALAKISVEAGRVELNSRKERAEIRMEFAAKDISYKLSRDKVARFSAYARLNENTRTNSILNFKSRLQITKILFDRCLDELVQRVRALERGLKLYKEDVSYSPAPPLRLLDDLSAWLTDVQSRLLARRNRKSTFIHSVAIPFSSFRASEGGQSFYKHVFGVADTNEARLLLKGLAFELLDSDAGPINVSVLPPPAVTNGLLESANPPTLQFGRVGRYSPNLDVRPQHVDRVWNGDPYDEPWTISIRASLGTEGAASLLMHLWLEEP